ncbi:MAG: AAA family ATPase [Candidatus Wallbacteria bacterium]|nr:AAA family ATPase [Candidatus Wallbacteria bacterium]
MVLTVVLPFDLFRSYAARPERQRNTVRAAPGSVPIVIDEVHKMPELLGVVQSLIEEDRRWRFIMTGSSARKLERSGVNLLAGRAHLQTMHPLMAAERDQYYQISCRFSGDPWVRESPEPFV